MQEREEVIVSLGKIPGGAPFSQLHKSGNGSRVDRPYWSAIDVHVKLLSLQLPDMLQCCQC